MRYVKQFLLAGAVLCLGGSFASAQTVDAYFGLGTMTDTSNGQSVDTFGTGSPYNSPALGGTFANVGGDVMVTPHLGFNANLSWRTSQGGYDGLLYRPMFYDFNGVYAPTGAKKRIVPVILAGLGGVHLGYYENQSACDAFVGCSSSNTFIESSNHFQAHFGAGVKFDIYKGIFLQPQVDVRWVNNFFQFGSNWVPEYSAQLGYRFGGKE